MNTKTVKLIGKQWPQYIIARGDEHLGNQNSHKSGIARCNEDCKTHLWLNHGDLVEGIVSGDKRFSIEEHGTKLEDKVATLLDCCTTAAEMVSTIKHTCIGLIEGNHEGAVSRCIGGITRHICKLGEVPNLGQTHFVSVTGAAKPITWFVAHGTKSVGRGPADVEMAVLSRERMVRQYLTKTFHADICGVGHGHVGVIHPPVFKRKICVDLQLTPVLEKSGWVYMTPSFFKVYGPNPSYAEAKNYPPSDLGWLRIYIDKNGNVPAIHHVNEDGKVIAVVEPKVVS